MGKEEADSLGAALIFGFAMFVLGAIAWDQVNADPDPLPYVPDACDEVCTCS